MMGKARYRRKIESLEAQIQEYQEKIERRKATPDEGLIYHWEREIKAFQDSIHRAQKRIGTQR
jgi:peptidoglycan hydrolase CwlO-like protein